MIGYLIGTILRKNETSLILNVSGVGYLVFVSEKLLEDVKEGKELGLWIYTRVAEGVLDLYGFAEEDELKFFKQLISVSGVGPKTALGFFDMPINKLKQAILNGDSNYVSEAKGVGKKTAEKICIDLKNKIELKTSGEITVGEILDQDVIDALVSLGYEEKIVKKILPDCPNECESSEDKIKWCLRNL